MTRRGVEALDALRGLRVAVALQPDQDREGLIGQLRRIGCEALPLWPAPVEPPLGAQVVFLQLGQSFQPALSWSTAEGAPTLIAVVEYENPLMLKALLDSGAHGILVKPLRPSGVLSMLALARSIHGYQRRLEAKARKLEETLKAHRDVSKAARLLAEARGIPESRAYGLIRAHATRRRIPLAQVAAAIIGAQDLLKDLA